MSETDATPLRALALNDDAAWAAFLATHRDAMVAAAEAVLGDRALAEDAAQDACLRIRRRADRFTGRGDGPAVRSWAAAIARSAAIDLIRRRRGVRREVDLGTAELTPLTQIALTNPPETTPLASLPERQRRVLELRYLRGASYEEIVRELGCGTVDAARQCLHRALRAARRLAGLLALVLSWHTATGAERTRAAALASGSALVLCLGGATATLGTTTPIPTGDRIVADGIHDDAPALQRQLDALVGCRLAVPALRLPPGLIRLSRPLCIPGNAHGYADLRLIGAGRDRTVLRLDSQHPAMADAGRPVAVVGLGDTARAAATVGEDGPHALLLSVRDLSIDTGAGNPGAIALAVTPGRRAAVRDVTLTATGGIGLRIQPVGDGGLLLADVRIHGARIGIDIGDGPARVTISQLDARAVDTGVRSGEADVVVADSHIAARGPAIASTAQGGLISVARTRCQGDGDGGAAIDVLGGLMLADVSCAGYAGLGTDHRLAAQTRVNVYGSAAGAIATAVDLAPWPAPAQSGESASLTERPLGAEIWWHPLPATRVLPAALGLFDGNGQSLRLDDDAFRNSPAPALIVDGDATAPPLVIDTLNVYRNPWIEPHRGADILHRGGRTLVLRDVQFGRYRAEPGAGLLVLDGVLALRVECAAGQRVIGRHVDLRPGALGAGPGLSADGADVQIYGLALGDDVRPAIRADGADLRLIGVSIAATRARSGDQRLLASAQHPRHATDVAAPWLTQTRGGLLLSLGSDVDGRLVTHGDGDVDLVSATLGGTATRRVLPVLAVDPTPSAAQ